MKRTHYTSELKDAIGKEAIVKGWVHDIRLMGGINFLLLRDMDGIVQITAPRNKISPDILKKIEGLHNEDVIDVKGTVQKTAKTKTGIEIIPKNIEIISASEPMLPLDPRRVTKANLDTKLDWRSLDLRSPENLAVFKIQSKLMESMEEYLIKNKFMKVFTPSLIGGISEGGSEVFSVVYYDKQVFLRQDPQLHRELLIAGGFERIFETGPSWRAEKSHTVRHMSEHRTIAAELAFIEDEHDVMKMEEGMVVNALEKVKKECGGELEILNKEIKIPKTPFPELQFPKIYDILKELGKPIQKGEDLNRESEETLSDYVKEKFKSDFFFVNKFPFAVKPFYVMRADDRSEWARSIDMVFKGTELSSGGQREHRYPKLISQIKEKGLNLDSLKWFTEVFKYGVPPMGGFSLGIERFTMKLLDIENVREATLFPRDTERILP
ncbi:MAG: aspartate--tRNA(Asn) ligase [Candidatus Aenigmarchaeota archaeon]|nr:aspartate--tRNA(Asn) ligase [Candidatus Aenigmarchaeota archaeon]